MNLTLKTIPQDAHDYYKKKIDFLLFATNPYADPFGAGC